ncbi:hypothetical protein ACWCO0_19070 [Streptomyces tubercidicus]|uniref:Uncharacterized protein n=1 Tax=Streptomyces tubercidicus TaxID=47759 RepID=A0A640UQ52_9ACTN|nr:hypothetical protein [Streptomyces tubercidicus]WAU12673.1 hypothetical protein STRTU_003056 [Streptomyces tubercidicus]GFE38153.1 hypothetical protein Stube_28260 [Streptomyces tubercidicus]
MNLSVNTERVKSVAVTASLTAWLIVTAAAQLPDTRFDSLLWCGKLRIPTPNWRFFGPNPGVKDSHLLYRDLTDGKPGEWKDIPVTRDRPWYALVWNARNRSPKALIDAIQGIRVRLAAAGSEMGPVVRSPGYLLLSRYIQHHLPHTEGASHSQFLLMHSYLAAPEDRRIEPFFVSGEFPLPTAGTPRPQTFPIAA